MMIENLESCDHPFKELISQVKFLVNAGLVAQWITRLTTDQKIAGSNPAEIVLLFFPKKKDYI